MKKKLIAITAATILMSQIAGCASCERAWVDLKSDVGNGLYRTINVYTADGELIATYEGKIDIEADDSGAIKFDFNGKRYIYYNCFVETIADIN